MSGKFWYANDLARDLGFVGMTPAFWVWCRKYGLQPTRGRYGFDINDVREALSRARTGSG